MRTGTFNILSIDGGGIRGIIPAAVLIQMESAVREARGDESVNIGECFDLIAGTSTGGILALLLLIPDAKRPGRARFSAKDALKLYMDYGDDIFDRSTWQKISSLGGLADEKYSAEMLEHIARNYFGDHRLSSLIRPCLVTAYDTKRYQPFFFTQHDAKTSTAREFLVRDAARATSAAPTYFSAALPESLDDIPNASPMIDGGVFANNPAACALVEAIRLSKDAPLQQFTIASLGTGRHPKRLTYGQINDWGLAGWARPVIDILMEGNAQTVDFQLRTIFESIGALPHYMRIDGNFTDTAAGLDIDGLDSRLDNASQANMRRLEAFGRQLAANAAPRIESFVKSYLVPGSDDAAPPTLYSEVKQERRKQPRKNRKSSPNPDPGGLKA